jgi:uncharacterized protein involved in exopolysaccharide biosynthesis/Mrp family chromosome partitioning ATPase
MSLESKENLHPGMSLAEVYSIIFRHKWKIICLSVAGITAAAVVYIRTPAVYCSEAKLFVRYVVDSKMPSSLGNDPQIRMSDPAGANIINSEVEILRSADLAEAVVDALSPERIVGGGANGATRLPAIQVVSRGLSVDVPPRSDILRVCFRHTDPLIVQPVLNQIIASYLKKHAEVHRAAGVYDEFLALQTDTLRAQLARTEEDLKAARLKSGVMNLEETERSYTEQIGRLRQSLFETEAELAAREASLRELQRHQSGKPEATISEPGVPSDRVNEYRSVCARLDSFRRREQELLLSFTETNSMVQAVRNAIQIAEKSQKDLERQFPGLVSAAVTNASPVGPSPDLQVEQARITSLRAKRQTLTNQLEKVTAEARQINEVGTTLSQLKRKKEIEEAQYRYFSSTLEQARFDQALGAGKTSNISIAQAPTAALRESRKLIKLLGMLVAGGFLGGVGLAFLIERGIDRSVKRASQIERQIHLPVFLSIPDLSQKRLALSNGNGNQRLALGPPIPSTGKESQAAGAESAPLSGQTTGRPYYEGLRDRLMTYFELKNLTRKPKLVAVAGCGRGAGVTTVAVGLASTLSETGGGNVLLVDMTQGEGAAHRFYRGQLAFGIEAALEVQNRQQALVHDNLYVVTEASAGDRLSPALPIRFSHLVPKLKASDYDYIIFDMPPVSAITVTPRLAGFMDMVLLVVESEKTSRDALKRASSLLADSKATVSAVLNKTRTYVPAWLHDEESSEV